VHARSLIATHQRVRVARDEAEFGITRCGSASANTATVTAGRIRGPPRRAHTQSASCFCHRSPRSALHVLHGRVAVRRRLHQFAVSRVKLPNIGSPTETNLARITFLRSYRCRLYPWPSPDAYTTIPTKAIVLHVCHEQSALMILNASLPYPAVLRVGRRGQGYKEGQRGSPIGGRSTTRGSSEVTRFCR
jgi:hypothetical protein